MAEIERGWFGPEGAAAYMGISPNVVRKAAACGRLRAKRGPKADLRPGRSMKTCRRWCDEFMESMEDWSDGSWGPGGKE